MTPPPATFCLWPDTVDAYWADQACTIRFRHTRKNWGYTYRRLQDLHPVKRLGEFTADDLVAFVTKRGWEGPRWAPLSARNQRIALSGLFGWAYLVGWRAAASIRRRSSAASCAFPTNGREHRTGSTTLRSPPSSPPLTASASPTGATAVAVR